VGLGRRAAKRDKIEKEVIAVARSHGWEVQQLDVFDLICCRRGVLLAVEVKSGEKARLTESQKALQMAGWPLVIVRSVEDAQGVFK
jgi:Holliday junction resolvase